MSSLALQWPVKLSPNAFSSSMPEAMYGACAGERGVGAMLRQQEASATQSHWQILQLAPAATPGELMICFWALHAREGYPSNSVRK